MSSFIDLVKTRRSVRTFDGNGVSPEVLEDLKSFAKEITNPYGVQSIRFEFLDREKMTYQALFLAARSAM